MDHASLAVVVTDLLTTIPLWSGYLAPPASRKFIAYRRAAIAERVGHKPCGVRAYYRLGCPLASGKIPRQSMPSAGDPIGS